MASPLYSLPEIQENQSGKYITHNEALALIEGLISRVLSRSNSGAPSSPFEGDTYIVDDNSGDWSAASIDDIAHYYSGAWHFLTPIEGLAIWCVDESGRIFYNGSSWQLDFTSRITLNANLNNEDAVGIVDVLNVSSNGVGFGAALTFNSSGDLIEADVNDQSTMPCSCLALETGTGNKQVLFWGRIRNDAWSFSVGSYIYIGTTSGILVDESGKPSGSGEIVQVVGITMASNLVFFNPSYVTVLLS